MDMRIAKTFDFSERVRLHSYFEFFNLSIVITRLPFRVFLVCAHPLARPCKFSPVVKDRSVFVLSSSWRGLHTEWVCKQRISPVARIGDANLTQNEFPEH